MSKCDLQIELQGPERTFRPGEAIKGSLSVEVDSDCTCRALTVEAGWKTHGHGNRTQGTGPMELLGAGEWKAGDKQRYEFSLTAPSGPVTYHGHYLNVDWVVRARADIPWAIDPKAEEEIVLQSGPAEQYDFGPKHKDSEEAFAQAGKGRGCAVMLGLIFALAGLAFSLAGLDAIATIVGGIFIVVGLFIFFMGIRKDFAQRKIGKPQVRIEPLLAPPGKAIDVSVDLKPTAGITLADVHLKLVGKEVVVRGSGTNRHTYTHPLHEQTVALAEPGRKIHPGEPFSLSGKVEVPYDAGPSFTAVDNKLEWSVVVHLGIENWPDWVETYPVSILPVGFV